MEFVNLTKKIENWTVSKLKPYERNARTHSSEQVDRIAASIAEFGMVNPVLISSDGTIRAGHGRVEAAKRLGMESIPVIILDHLSDEQARAYTIADNRLGELSDWDNALLADELKALESLDFDLNSVGFSDDELAKLAATLEGATDSLTGSGGEREDSEDEPEENGGDEKHTKSGPGDVWVLGKHRLTCGEENLAECDVIVDAWEEFSGGKGKLERKPKTIRRAAKA